MLEVFWHEHDPTQLNRQGPDVGDQYRSVVFFHNDDQKAARAALEREQLRAPPAPVVTQVVPAATFWPAEDYHQQYLEKRGLATCRIPPARQDCQRQARPGPVAHQPRRPVPEGSSRPCGRSGPPKQTLVTSGRQLASAARCATSPAGVTTVIPLFDEGRRRRTLPPASTASESNSCSRGARPGASRRRPHRVHLDLPRPSRTPQSSPVRVSAT